MMKPFATLDVENFWEPSYYKLQQYVGPTLTDKGIASVERELGYKLPASYVELMRFQNGGIPCRTRHRTRERTSWADDHIAISGIYSIGSNKPYSLCGPMGSRFWIAGVGLPRHRRVFRRLPVRWARHDVLGLQGMRADRRATVVHVDQEWEYRIVCVADTFEAFVLGLEDESAFEGGA